MSKSVTIQNSPNYRNGQFQNIHDTPQLTEGYTISGVLYEFLFKRGPRRKPSHPVPSVKTDLLNIRQTDNVLVWFGHSSYFIQLDGKKILVDPVFSGNASPIPYSNTAFHGSDLYSADDLPEIDILFITHDHYDHLDYKTIAELKHKVKKVICGLGVADYFKNWGYAPDRIVEKDWNEHIDLGNGFSVQTAPARHFAGRGLKRNQTLWMSYILQSSSMNIYIGGDSGYDTHFTEIGKLYGPIHLAMLDNGQYDPKWKYIHMQPDEVLQAAKDLNTAMLIPVHSGKFAMANHAWDEPIRRIKELNEFQHVPMITPMIGELINLKDINGKTCN